jgi:hypothetical protein
MQYSEETRQVVLPLPFFFPLYAAQLCRPSVITREQTIHRYRVSTPTTDSKKSNYVPKYLKIIHTSQTSMCHHAFHQLSPSEFIQLSHFI